jgi:hypothetical protein
VIILRHMCAGALIVPCVCRGLQCTLHGRCSGIAHHHLSTAQELRDSATPCPPIVPVDCHRPVYGNCSALGSLALAVMYRTARRGSMRCSYRWLSAFCSLLKACSPFDALLLMCVRALRFTGGAEMNDRLAGLVAMRASMSALKL